MVQICATVPLPAECELGYSAMAFDGSHYYFSAREKQRIDRFDSCFQNKKIISTQREFAVLCYDMKEVCFWAAAEGCEELLKLNCSFQEIGRVRIAPFIGKITGISYCCADNTLLVSLGDKILRVSKLCPQGVHELKHCPGAQVMALASLSPYYIYVALKDTQRLYVSDGDGTTLDELELTREEPVESILYRGQRQGDAYFQLLTTRRDRRQMLLNVKISGKILGGIYPCNDLISAKNPALLMELGVCAAPQEELPCAEETGCGCRLFPPLCGEMGCRPGGAQDCCPDPCACCRPSCGSCHCCCPPKPPCNGFNDVLESIALAEASIAHILNAEGEKLQKVIATCTCVSELLEVNREVNRTIVHVTHLEQTLYAKLEALCNCRAHCCQPCGESSCGACGDFSCDDFPCGRR